MRLSKLYELQISFVSLTSNSGSYHSYPSIYRKTFTCCFYDINTQQTLRFIQQAKAEAAAATSQEGETLSTSGLSDNVVTCGGSKCVTVLASDLPVMVLMSIARLVFCKTSPSFPSSCINDY